MNMTNLGQIRLRIKISVSKINSNKISRLNLKRVDWANI